MNCLIWLNEGNGDVAVSLGFLALWGLVLDGVLTLDVLPAEFGFCVAPLRNTFIFACGDAIVATISCEFEKFELKLELESVELGTSSVSS